MLAMYLLPFTLFSLALATPTPAPNNNPSLDPRGLPVWQANLCHCRLQTTPSSAQPIVHFAGDPTPFKYSIRGDAWDTDPTKDSGAALIAKLKEIPGTDLVYKKLGHEGWIWEITGHLEHAYTGTTAQLEEIKSKLEKPIKEYNKAVVWNTEDRSKKAQGCMLVETGL